MVQLLKFTSNITPKLLLKDYHINQIGARNNLQENLHSIIKSVLCTFAITTNLEDY